MAPRGGQRMSYSMAEVFKNPRKRAYLSQDGAGKA